MRYIPNNNVVQFTVQQLQARTARPVDRKDFLGAFLQAKQDHPDVVTDRQVLSYANSNVFAGSDTTAISLRAILYYLLKNPASMQKVVDEIDNVVGQRDCNQEPVAFAESNQMPYFQAVLKEAMRMHPAVGLLLERVVPAGGADIAGTFIPAGTKVGICPWVLHRDQRVFGPDADTFRPERWIEADPETLKVMNRSNLAVSRRWSCGSEDNLLTHQVRFGHAYVYRKAHFLARNGQNRAAAPLAFRGRPTTTNP